MLGAMSRLLAVGPAPWSILLCALAACGDPAADVHYRLVGLPRATATGCGAASAPPAVTGATRVRLTFRDRDGGPLRCDVVLPLPADAPPVVAVPERVRHAAMWVEYFDDAGALLARGAVADVALTGGGDAVIPIGPTGDYACAPTQATIARAFHSATRLPTGEVLLLGGLAGAPGGGGASFAPDDGAYAIAAPELYDPAAGTSRAVTIPGLLPRAFHTAHVLGQDADGVHLLVVGGHGVADDPVAAGNVAATPGGPGAPPWQPTRLDLARGRYGARALPAELLTYRPAAGTFTRVEVGAGALVRTEAALGAVGDSVAVVGGRLDSGAATPVLEAMGGATGEVLAMASGGRARVGATVTAVSATDAIVVGGDVGNDVMVVRAVEHVAGLPGQPTFTPGPVATSAVNRAYHAAALLGDRVLAVGGLHLAPGGVEDQGPAALAVRISSTNFSASALDTGTAPAVAYPEALTLHDSGVLVAGGATPGACARTLTCPASSSLRFEATATPTVAPAGALGRPRYGHRLTRLADDTVLVTGGFAVDPADAARLVTLATTERFEPHRAGDDPLADLLTAQGWTRTAGDVARDAGGAPVALCTRVGAPVDAAIDALVLDAPIDAP